MPEQCVDNRRENKHINDLPLMYRLLSLALVFPLSATLGAQDELATTGDIGYASRRVFRGVERSSDAMQASASVAKAGWRGTLWSSFPFEGSEPDEVNLNVGYTAKLSDTLSVGIDATQFWFGHALAGATKQSFEAGVEATWTARDSLTLTLAYHRDFRLKADSIQGSLGYSLPLTKLGAFLELSAFAGWVDGSDIRPDASGPAVGDGYGYFGAEAYLPYRIGSQTTVLAGVHFADSVSQSRFWSPIGAGGGSRGWVTLSVSFDF
jgi:hypothetical protein